MFICIQPIYIITKMRTDDQHLQGMEKKKHFTTEFSFDTIDLALFFFYTCTLCSDPLFFSFTFYSTHVGSLHKTDMWAKWV